MSSMCLEPTLDLLSSSNLLERLASSHQHIKVFCDLDGPLIDVSQRYYKTYQLALANTQALAKLQGNTTEVTPLSRLRFWQMKQDRVPDVEIAHCSGLHPTQIEPFLAYVQEIVNHPELLQEDRLQRKVMQTLQVLQNYGIEVSVVTLRWQPQAKQILREFQVDHHFAEICGMDDPFAAYQNYTASKQQLLSAVMVQAGIDTTSHDCWMIGDTEADILAGQALGLSTIAVTCGMRNYRYLQQLQSTSIQPNLSIAIDYLLSKVGVVY
jgi:phosphoglycolate phosphatase